MLSLTLDRALAETDSGRGDTAIRDTTLQNRVNKYSSDGPAIMPILSMP